MLEFVDSGLYFVQDENNFKNPLLQIGSGGPKNQQIRPDPDPTSLDKWKPLPGIKSFVLINIYEAYVNLSLYKISPRSRCIV